MKVLLGILIVLLSLSALPAHAQWGRYDRSSLNDPYGPLCSPYSPYIIRNPYGYSSQYSANPPKIYSLSGKYLGELSADPYRLDSISNPYGRYGSPYSTDSIRNPYGRYSAQPFYLYRRW